MSFNNQFLCRTADASDILYVYLPKKKKKNNNILQVLKRKRQLYLLQQLANKRTKHDIDTPNRKLIYGNLSDTKRASSYSHLFIRQINYDQSLKSWLVKNRLIMDVSKNRKGILKAFPWETYASN